MGFSIVSRTPACSVGLLASWCDADHVVAHELIDITGWEYQKDI